jgi:DNA polymerase elongation subunit (family B)
MRSSLEKNKREEVNTEMETTNCKDARILIFDLETAPNLAYVWDMYEQNVIANKQERYILSVSYKWLHEKKVYSYALPDFKLYKKDPTNDRELVKELRFLFDEADIVIAHNGNEFDIKMANAAFLRHGLRPPSPFRSIDTLKILRSNFRLNSNKLNDVGELLGIGEKVETGGWKLWEGCIRGDKSAWEKMVRYNKNDVILLEKVYLKLRGWMNQHPSLNSFSGVDNCPSCGSDHLHARGWSYSNLSRRKRYQCQNCGRWSSGTAEKIGIKIR